MYNAADLISFFLLGTVFGIVGLLLIIIHIGRKAQR